MVKNTFIDDAESSSGEEEEAPLMVRSMTAPMPQRKHFELDSDEDTIESTESGSSSDMEAEGVQEEDEPKQQVPCEVWPPMMAEEDSEAFVGLCDTEGDDLQEVPSQAHIVCTQSASASWPRTMSGDDLQDFLGFVGPTVPSCSIPVRKVRAPEAAFILRLEESLSDVTTASASSDCSAQLPADQLNAEPPSVDRQGCSLVLMVQQECSFLKIISCTMMQLAPRSSKTKREAPSGVSRYLRVCDEGLPSLKRHKWQQPLAWAVAGVLERKQCLVAVRRGELFA